MFKKLDDVETRYNHLEMELQNPHLAEDQKKYRELMKEFASLEEVVKIYRKLKKTQQEIEDVKEILNLENNEDLRSMAKLEMNELSSQQVELNQELFILLLPKDPNDDKNIILEIRAGAGGDEASLFAEELFKAYAHYANQNEWKVEILSISPGNVGGVKEICAHITGEKVFSKLKYESGVHRVQRVPKTEAQGRVHTSTVTVAVLPEADEVEVKIDPTQLRIDVCRASGAGGQHVNKTESAVRVTHLPSGIVVYCQDGRSQHANKDRALKILYSRLLAAQEEKTIREASEQRLSQIGTGDRSERIRTYNFPQSRVTDHRIGLTLHSLNEIMNGAVQNLIDPLVTHYQALALQRSREV